VGTTLDGKVTRIMPYGAFVELASGVEGMVHVSEMSWSKAARPESLARVGDIARVKVIGMEPDRQPGLLKISLSMKQLTADPWNNAGDLFHQGDKVQGTVTRCAKFGAFVEVAPGIEGLIHISEISYTKRVLKPEEVVTAGETVAVMIKEVDLEKRRLSLSLRDAEGDPWVDITQKYKIGQALEGKLEKKEKFGFFINLEPGITGLLPKSNLNRAGKPADLEKLKEGDGIPIIIEAINPGERKITLTPADSADEQDWQSFSDASANSLGALGEKLQLALDKKKGPQ
jgi:small subunit ribosomal protein S1